MKLGLFTVLYPELDLESILELAQQLGCGASSKMDSKSSSG